MRWKLLVLVSLIASLVGCGIAIAIIFFLSRSPGTASLRSFDLVALSPLIFPLALIIAASFFVYRHTAKRRRLQAIATALLSAILMIAFFFVTMLFLIKRGQDQPPVPPPSRIASRISPRQHT
jgi:amino acid transporter